MRHHCRRRNRGSHFNTLPPWLSVNNHSVGTPYSPHIAKLKEMHRSIRPQGSSTNDVTRFGRKIDSPSPLYHMWSQSQISEPPAKMTLQAYELPLPQKAIPHSLHSRCVQWSPLSCIAKKPTCSHFHLTDRFSRTDVCALLCDYETSPTGKCHTEAVRKCQISANFKNQNSRLLSRTRPDLNQLVWECWSGHSKRWRRLLGGYSRCSPTADVDTVPARSHDRYIGPCRARWVPYRPRAPCAARNPNICSIQRSVYVSKHPIT